MRVQRVDLGRYAVLQPRLVVLLAQVQEPVDLVGDRVGGHRPPDRQFLGDHPDGRAPVGEQAVVADDATRHASGRTQGFGDRLHPQRDRERARERVALVKRLGDLGRMADRKHDLGGNALRCEDIEPKLEELAEPGILDAGQRRVAELVADQLRQVGAGRDAPSRILPVRRQRPRVVPAAAEFGQPTFVQGEGGPVLPESGVVFRRGRQ